MNSAQLTVYKKFDWAKYYENQKRLWYDPYVPLIVKAVIRIVELHRSDSEGWSLSVRKIAKLLGVSPNTATKSINLAIISGFLQASSTGQRKRRKLRLSVSLRATDDFNKHSSEKLSKWESQPVPPAKTQSVLHIETVNSKEISKTNNNSVSDRGYWQIIKKRKELGV